jgi:hypothetical protein
MEHGAEWLLSEKETIGFIHPQRLGSEVKPGKEGGEEEKADQYDQFTRRNWWRWRG